MTLTISNNPPIVIGQYLKFEFFENLDRQLAKESGRRVLRLAGAMTLERGTIYVAGIDAHFLIKDRNSKLILSTEESDAINGHRPSVDRLFINCSSLKIKSLVAILLTSMGKDGALGLSQLYQRGAWTLVQDEASSTVFGIPRHAIELGAAHKIGNPTRLRQLLIEHISASEPQRTHSKLRIS